jgi:hypothetical protein
MLPIADPGQIRGMRSRTKTHQINQFMQYA